MKQIIFLIVLLLTIGAFTYTSLRLYSWFKLLKPAFPVTDIGKRLKITLEVAFGQTKIMRRPLIGFIHAMVWWGFIVILFGSIEMVIDGLAGTERVLSFMGGFYEFLTAAGDIFALIIAVAMIIFLVRRNIMHIARFEGPEMKKISHQDANLALTIILFLMLSLLGMNTFYILDAINTNPDHVVGLYPVSNFMAYAFVNLSSQTIHFWHEFNWWAHICLIFLFANILPYSKHFHVFMSVPNVFLSRLQPLGYIDNMPNVTEEVKLMMDPNAAFSEPSADEEILRFGVKDVEDATWKNYLDSLACTQCGRCTSVCPANITGKLLSPRKVMINMRERMKEKAPNLVKDANFDDDKSLLRDYILEEELWACTLCNACAQECPININHPSLIVSLRRYLVMEESAAPAELNTVFSNIENNGAPWQFSPDDRLNWANEIYIEE